MDDSGLGVTLDNIEKFYISEAKLQDYVNTPMLDKSAYYYFNATFAENIVNGDEIVIEMMTDNRRNNLFGYLSHVLLNLDRILAKLKIDLKVYYNPLKFREKTIELQEYYQSYIPPPLTFSPNLKNVHQSPFVYDLFLKQMSEIFSLDVGTIYIANRATRYFRQRSAIANAFILEGITPNFSSTNIDSKLETNIGIFLTELSMLIDFPRLRKITQTYTANDSWASQFLVHIFTIYSNLSTKNVADQLVTLDDVENNIIPIISKYNPQPEPEVQLPPSDLSLRAENMIKCEYDIGGNTVFKVLNVYERILDGGIKVSAFANVCPIQVRYILNTFNYYKGKEIYLRGDEICTNPVQNIWEEEKPKPHTLKKFEQLKRLISFDCDYRTFQGLVSQVHFSEHEIHALSSIYYNMDGFKCATIIAELLNFHFNLAVNAQSMYILMSRISAAQHAILSRSKPCKMTTRKINLLNYYLLLMPNIPQSTDHIHGLCEKMLTANSFTAKIAIATKANCNIITLIQYLREVRAHRECADILIMTSNAPPILKEMVYKKLPRCSSDSTFNWDERDLHETTCVPEIPDVFEPTAIQLHPTNFNCVYDFMQCVKVKKDINLYDSLKNWILKR